MRARAPRGGRARRQLLLVVVPAVLFLVALIATYRANERAQHASAFCTASCHTPKDRREGEPSSAGDWHLKEHAAVSCQSCHPISTGAGLRLSFAGAATKDVVAHGRVDAPACASCHQKDAAKWAAIAATQGHRQHAGAKGVDCLSCHAKTSHGEAPPAQACVTCHENQRLHQATTPADAETCLSCHGFAATAKNAGEPTPKACARCHARATDVPTKAGQPLKNVDEHVLHGGVACQLCHNAHGKKTKPPEGQPVCVKCHQFEPFRPGHADVKGPEGHRNCEGCHQPHAPLGTATKSCVKCHENRVRGVPVAARGQPAPAAAPAPARMGAAPPSAPGGKTSALKHDGCPSCHLPHTWRAERSGCKQCHADKARLILTKSPAAHDACTNCHQVHGPPPSGAVCVSCHAKTKGSHVALAPERHKDCTACHDPHAPLPEDTRNACIKCHDTQVTQVTAHGPEGHKGCFGCHKPHDSPLPPPDVCAKCHADRARIVAAAAPPKHRTCTSCHEKHVFKIRDAKAACSTCHGPMFQAAAATVATTHEKAPHQGDCKTCHTLHGSPGISKGACLGCHANVATEFNPPNEKHATCRSCHRPHQPVSTARAACASCHESKALVATKWPPASAHAQACTGCHQQHDARKKKTCDACHAAETASAIGGRHACTQCHPPHGAPPGTGTAWWSRCNSCHAAKVESVKLRGPKHSDCKNCHQPHRFAVPSCTSCHADISKEGLHAVPQHAASCKSCHDPHVASAPTPTQCLTCHTDRRNHEPGTKQCQSCHMFR